jgi:cation transport ATPase
VYPAQTTGPEDHDGDILKGKRRARAGPVDADAPAPDAVQTLKAKLAGTAAASEAQDDELEILKAKSGNPGTAVDVERMDEVETLKAKLGGERAATEGQTTTRTARVAKSAEHEALPNAKRTETARVAAVQTKRRPQRKEAAPRRQSAFSLAFVLLLCLWGVALVLALRTGAQWWLFVLCSAATAGVAVFGFFDSTAFEKKSGQK